mgnify:CR=1 FL=1
MKTVRISIGIPSKGGTGTMGFNDFFYGKDINHSITHFKISMRTLFLNIAQNAPKNSSWISKKELKDLPSSLCKKVLNALKI